MIQFYHRLPKSQRIVVLVITVLLSIPVGGVLGFFAGLIATTFIPICCEGGSCHNCFQFRGMVGHEATGFLGFWSGLIVFPLSYVILLLYWWRKGKI